MIKSIKETLSVFIVFVIFLIVVITSVTFWILMFLPRAISIWIFSDRTFRESTNKVLIDSGLKDPEEEVI